MATASAGPATRRFRRTGAGDTPKRSRLRRTPEICENEESKVVLTFRPRLAHPINCSTFYAANLALKGNNDELEPIRGAAQVPSSGVTLSQLCVVCSMKIVNWRR